MILKNRSLWYLNFIFILNFIPNIYSKSIPQEFPENIIPELLTTIATEDELLTILENNKPTVIMGFMDHCNHCNTIAPEFEKMAHDKKYNHITFMKANGHGPHGLKIHKHVARESKNKFTIPGYPSFIFINHGKIVNVLIGGDKDKLEQHLKQFKKS